MNVLPAFSRAFLASVATVLCSAAIAQESEHVDGNGFYTMEDLEEALARTKRHSEIANMLAEKLFGDDGANLASLNSELECLENTEADLSMFGKGFDTAIQEFSSQVMTALRECEEADGVAEDGEAVVDAEESVVSELLAIVDPSFEKKAGSKGLGMDRVSSMYHYDRGLEHLEKRDYHKAEASFSKSIGAMENVAALRMRSAMLLKRGNLDAAMADLGRCIELDRGNEMHYLTRAVTRQVIGDHEGAIDDYSRAIDLQPDAPRAWGNRGLAWMRVGRNDKAITDLDQSLKIWSEYPEGLYNRGVVRQKLKDYEGAASDYARALDIRPGWDDVRHNYDLVLAKLAEEQGT